MIVFMIIGSVSSTIFLTIALVTSCTSSSSDGKSKSSSITIFFSAVNNVTIINSGGDQHISIEMMLVLTEGTKLRSRCAILRFSRISDEDAPGSSVILLFRGQWVLLQLSSPQWCPQSAWQTWQDMLQRLRLVLEKESATCPQNNSTSLAVMPGQKIVEGDRSSTACAKDP